MDFIMVWIVILVLIASVTEVCKKALDVMAVRGKTGRDSKSVQTELAAIRQEMAALKSWASDLILSFDSTLHQQDARLKSIERHMLSLGSNPAHPGIAPGGAPVPAEPAPSALDTRARV